MSQSVMLGEKMVEYIVKRRFRARGVKLSVGISGVVTVTAPMIVPMVMIVAMLHQKAVWIVKSLERMEIRRVGALTNSVEDYQAQKKSALFLACERVEHFNIHYGFNVKKISVRRQTSRWGSCSRAGALNFNYHIVRLTPELVDYIVVHELCHIGMFNHSPKFWSLVAETIPEYKTLRRQLKSIGLMKE